ncbi:hypothetical protein Tco_0655122 [Tanacetum coccineum]|uniref:Uncharacterized protein n=1 Tax=Tanacetum coccineum TaxID=301880 RepID=A0ABQ4X5N7_9ASTR
MTESRNIPRRLHEHYYRVENDEVVKLTFNSGKNKEGDGMKIPDWMLMEEMKHTAHYQMFRVRSQPDPETPIPTAAEIDIDSLNEATRLSIARQRSLEDLEAQQNVEKFQEHITDEDLDQILEEPRSDKEILEVKKSDDVIIIHDDEEKEESAIDALIRRKGKGIEEIRDSPPPTPIRSPRTLIIGLYKKQNCTDMALAPVSRDDLCPPHKQDDLMDANKKIDRHSLKLDDSKDKFKFFLDSKELQFPVNDLKRIFELPQATKNNNEGLYYSYFHPTSLIPYPRFTKIVIDHYMTKNLDILRRLHEHYPRVENDEVVKSIFNSGKNKEGEGMKIPDWMLMEEMKHTAHYQMFRVLSQPNPEMPIPIVAEIDIDSLNEATRLNIATQRSLEDLEAQQNVEKIDPRSDKESPEVKKSADMLIIHDDEEEEESVGDALIKRKGKGIEEIRDSPPPTPTPIRS